MAHGRTRVDTHGGTVLVAVDGSALAGRALSIATSLAEATGRRLVLLHAEAPARPARLEPAPGTSRSVGAGAHVGWARGDLAAAILAEAVASDAVLVVLPIHRPSTVEWPIRASVVDRVLRESPAPVLAVPRACVPAGPGDRIGRLLVPLDGSLLAEQALGPAAALARALGGTLVLVRVVPPAVGPARYSLTYTPAMTAAARRYLDPIAAGLRTHGIDVRGEVATGPVAQSIVALAPRLGADAIVMATRGRSGLARLLGGSVTGEAVRAATVPILVVPPSAVGAAATEIGSTPATTATVPPRTSRLRRGRQPSARAAEGATAVGAEAG
jgi:nucleotide-binding universal stress UspA family protein